jgi:hypothetical protein
MIVSASHAGAHDERNLFASVEILRHRREAGASDRQNSQHKDKSHTRSNGLHHGLAGVGRVLRDRYSSELLGLHSKNTPMPATISHHHAIARSFSVVSYRIFYQK